MKDSFTDRRKHVRIPMVSVIQINIDQEGFVPAMLVDLSAGGARIVSQFSLATDQRIALRLSLYEYETIEVGGRLIWTREMDFMKEYNFGIEYMGGIQFDEVNDKINDFIRRYTRK